MSRSEFRDMLGGLRRQGITRLCRHRIWTRPCAARNIYARPRPILTTGTPRQLIDNPGERLYNAAAHDMFGLLSALRQLPEVADCCTFGATLHVVAGEGFDADRVEEQLHSLGIADAKIFPAQGDIEDLFKNSHAMTTDTAIKLRISPNASAVSRPSTQVSEVRRGDFRFPRRQRCRQDHGHACFGGLSVPTASDCTVAGCDIRTQVEGIKRRIGYMSQRFSLYEALTVDDNLRLATVYGLDGRETDASRQHMPRARDGRYPPLACEGPSRGWRQLAFAVATIHRPRCSFLDEPTGGVDPHNATALRAHLQIGVRRNDGIRHHTLSRRSRILQPRSIMVDGWIAALDTPASLKEK